MTRSSKILNTGRDSITAACSSALRRSASDTREPLRRAQGGCSELALQKVLDALLKDLELGQGPYQRRPSSVLRRSASVISPWSAVSSHCRKAKRALVLPTRSSKIVLGPGLLGTIRPAEPPVQLGRSEPARAAGNASHGIRPT